MRTRTLAVWTLALVFVGCGQTKMVQTTGKIRAHMLNSNYQAALATLRIDKKDAYKEQDRVAFWLDEGMLLHLTGNFKQSTDALSQAEKRSIELYTTSVSKSITAAFTSDAAKDYEGEDYEKVLIHVVKAFNFMSTGDENGALVEARKINEKLALFNTKYKHKNVYNQDAFAHWLMGLLFEMEKSYDDARIAYAKAYEVYGHDFAGNYGFRPPAYVGEDIVRASILGNAADEVAKWKGKVGGEAGKTADLMKTHGEVVVFHMNGEGPSKSDYFVNCWFLGIANWRCDGEPGGEFMKKTTIMIPKGGTTIKVAFPILHVHAPSAQYMDITVGGQTGRSLPAYPLNEIAMKTLADKMHRIFRDAMIRIVTKLVTSKAAGAIAGKAGGKLFGWIAEKGSSAIMQAFEEADKRAWTTLPARIDVARVWATPGTHTLTIMLSNGRRATIPNVKVAAGQKVILTYRSL
ncbi:MAG: hypothetical protein IT371_15035 [Deltaproteobacteria bacterium]|nr:hypothetical protein [Deltaproteobacteria bacterium]